MDTISRENNSMLPVGGIIVGAIGLLLGGLALLQVSKVNKTVTEQHTALTTRVDGFESQISSAAQVAERAKNDVAALQRSTQTAFDTVGPELARLAGAITKLEDAAKRPVQVAGKKNGAPAVAGPDEYIVKGGDTGMKIANAQGVAVKDLMDVNPGVNWSGLKVGQKIKLPAKR